MTHRMESTVCTLAGVAGVPLSSLFVHVDVGFFFVQSQIACQG